MADLDRVFVLPGLLCLLAQVTDVAGGEFCPRYFIGLRDQEYCYFGCCGYLNNECCNINIGIVVGAVIGGLVLIAVIATVVCCCVKKQGYAGRVVGPFATGGNVTVVNSNMMAAPGYMAPQGYGPPPPYNPAANYGYSTSNNTAYLPGSSQGFAAPAVPAYAPPDGTKRF